MIRDRFAFDECPNCGKTLAWISDSGHGVGPCPLCAAHGAHGGDCRHATGEIFVRYCSHPDGHAPADCPDRRVSS